MRTLNWGAGMLLVASWIGSATARDNIEINYDINGQTGTRGFSTVQSVVDALSNNALASISSSYTDTSPATAQINLRGVPAVATYSANSTALRVQIPVAGLDRVFQGNTREESARLFQRYLEGNGGSGTVNALLRASTHSSPIDPVSGGPNSALTQLAVSDFSRAALGSASQSSGFGIGASIGSFTAAGYNSTNITIPIDASWRITDRDTVSFEAPLAYTTAGGATSYAGNGGVLYRRRVTDDWQVQFSGRIGAAGSIDLGAGSGIYGLGAVSTFRFTVQEAWRVTVVNAINYVSTFPANIGSLSLNYNVANTVFRNGVILSHNTGFTLAGIPLAVSGYAVDTRFAGSPVFVRNFQEFGVYVAPGQDARFGIGLQVMTGDRGLFGVTMSTGVRF